uniref:Coiled-coil-helix-coiled-coil-helix domain containing 3 n=1 Tax=Phasianus colchicus TaxID=9054 RepID=A0A669QTQ2_PHACC
CTGTGCPRRLWMPHPWRHSRPGWMWLWAAWSAGCFPSEFPSVFCRLKQEQEYVRDEFGKILERERVSSNEHLTRAILRERAATEEERQKAQRFARQLEEKDRELKKHDAYYKEQLARLEERSAQFYKVTTEQYQKAADEVSARFKRYETQPVCADLQGKILQCYQQHAQETLSCSALASQYLHCVNHAKQVSVGILLLE